MSERLTDEDLDELESWGTSPNPSTTRLVVKEIRALRARVKTLEAALEQWRKELCSLCEDTEERCSGDAKDLEGKEGAYARGRIREAKGIRKAMGEVIYEDLAALKGKGAGEL